MNGLPDGQLNLSANCLDRHLKEHPYKPAIIWEGDHPSRHKIISFAELYDEVCRFANVLKKHGVVKGDRVVLYMPMISEAAISMLACAESVPCIVWCLVVSRLIHWRAELMTVKPKL